MKQTSVLQRKKTCQNKCENYAQCPQSLAPLAVGGSSKLVVVVGVGVALSIGEGEGDLEGVADGEWQEEGSCNGPPGHGHVVSFERSGQNFS